MASLNANTPRGFVPYAYTWGAPYNGAFRTYYVPSSYGTALYVGDPVDIKSSYSDAIGTPGILRASSGSPVVGVVIGVVNGGPTGAQVPVLQNTPVYHPASTAQYIAVADDPNLLFWIQDDASTQNTYAPNVWSGLNANYAAGSGGSTVTGYSSFQLQASSVAATNTLDLKIISALNEPDNVVGTAANTNMNAKWLVKLNNSRFANQIAGIV